MSLIKFLVSKVFWLQVLIAILFTIGIIYGTMIYLESYTRHGVTVEVPDLSGYHHTEATPLLEKQDLHSIISDSIYVAEEPPGTIVDQNPNALTEVKPGRKIYLTINTQNPPQVVLPALNDLTLRQAQSRIITYGLKIDTLIYRPSECTNCIVGAQLRDRELKPGDKVDKGTAISLIVGSGESDEVIPIPALYGQSLEQAKKFLNSKGLNIGIVQYDEKVDSEEDTMSAVIYNQFPAYDTNRQEMINLGRSMDVFLTTDSTKIPEFELIEQDSITTQTDS
ncbi:PASTA domain-containing protein [Salibacter sp.]|uniref:PASTA domain-containing protein n=1 Tax=Salibacter sp. TaxID=2010995 RepID=UPI0028705343|nr:PASTA domain-containing protein [Salibacter sp.]MDR9399400.1 PASTA domain-containing protein [Salibacter sp.]MDR9488324.1 PASTA domain-containing protein [Salibacter sp.]